MNASFLKDRCTLELEQLRNQGVFKRLEVLEAPQSSKTRMKRVGDVIVMSSNNYLGLANHPDIKKAAHQAIDEYGCGTASVRFICGTLAIHEDLEKATSQFVGQEASTTYASCWNANEAAFPTLFQEGDLVVSDSLNHASIIDGLRLMKGVDRKVYPHLDLKALEELLKQSNARVKAIVTDGVFSMEGHIAPLPDLLDLAKKYQAILVVDDSHATGVLGATGKGTAEHFNLPGNVIDVLTGTYGKALGGAAGGFIASQSSIVELCVQRSRPQLFSNALPPPVAASALASIRLLSANANLVKTLKENTRYFRSAISELGFKPLQGDTPIVPVIVGETSLAIQMSHELLKEGIFVTGFGHPVVPKGEARLRIQLSAAHTKDQLDQALAAFKKVGTKFGVI